MALFVPWLPVSAQVSPHHGKAGMSVGDLIYDEHYAFGIVVEVQRTGCVILFTDADGNRRAWLDKRLYDTIEVINESR